MNLEAWKILLEGITPDGTGCTTVDPKYGNGNAVELETGLFLYGLVRREQPIGLVLETGTHLGYSSSAIALALKDNITLYPEKYETWLYTVDFSNYDFQPEKLWMRLGLDNIKHQIGDSERPESYLSIPEGLVTLAWYDADHDGPAIFREYQATFRCLNKGRCIIGWHDTSLDVRMAGGIQLILEDLKKRQRDGSGWKHISHVFLRNMRGLDLVFLSNENI